MKKMIKSALCLGLIVLTSCAHQNRDQEYLMSSTLWVQNSAEWRGLSYQAFNLAKRSLQDQLQKKKGQRRPLALVVDVDETIVDNSAFQAQVILYNRPYSSETWKAWVDKKEAKLMPGAINFLSWAHNQKVAIFYITNRKSGEYDATLENIKKLGLPIEKDHLLVRTDSSSKKARRESVAKKFDIVLFMGDNMADFSELYEKKTTDQRAQLADSMAQDFGQKFILLPNPMYGDWEGAIYDNNFSLTDDQKEQKRKKALKR